MIEYKFEKHDYDDIQHFKGIKNMVLRSDFGDSESEEVTLPQTQNSLLSRRSKLHTSGCSRKFAQQLDPNFYTNQRATTANTNAVRMTESARSKRSPLKIKSGVVDMKALTSNTPSKSILTQQIVVPNFKSYLDALHRKTLTSKFADTKKVGNIFKGDLSDFQQRRRRNVKFRFNNGKLLVKLKPKMA